MTTRAIDRARAAAVDMLRTARVAVRPDEIAAMEVTDLGLGDFKTVGIQVLVYENNDRYCAKELILLPRQTCPEHRHPPISARNAGKQETFRCRWGEIYLYVDGEPAPKPKARIPAKYASLLTARHEIVLKPGDQFTLPPNSLHWFQAGDKGAVVSEFSSTSTDENDVFTDPRIRRVQG
ncbi:MAG: D-lyxose/D-mannose family sugar isomerase [Candidatus Aminicenantes bacterium]|nr:D-lyxose/D-mannose family sugar isomerase [Candidatus Aminicenantes bacterium]